MIYHDAIVVGGGLAGLRALSKLNRNNVKVAIVHQKVHPIRSHSVAAQGLMRLWGTIPAAAPIIGRSTPLTRSKEAATWQTKDAVIRMTKDAARRVVENGTLGLPFQPHNRGKSPKGRLAARGFHAPAMLRIRRATPFYTPYISKP